MKKFLFILLFGLASCGLYAQKGMQGVGMSLDGGVVFDSYNDVYFPLTTIKYQYYVHDYIRLVPSLGLGIACFNPYIKTDFFFTPINKFRAYSSIGLGYNLMWFEDSYFSFLLGIGTEWRVAYNWTIQCSGNFAGNITLLSYAEGGVGGYVSIGFVYNF